MNNTDHMQFEKTDREIPEELKDSDHYLVKSDIYMLDWLNCDGSIESSDNMASHLLEFLNKLQRDGESIVKIVAQVDICKNEYMNKGV